MMSVNLLSNAIRHNPDDSMIDVSARTVVHAVEFRVRDHGAGIRPEHRDRLFDRYFRATAVPRLGSGGQASGTGLGLAISKEFIASRTATLV